MIGRRHDPTGRSSEKLTRQAAKHRNKISKVQGQFITHSVAMRASVAWRCLPDNARRILDRLELEHAKHGGRANGSLPCTYEDFEEAGIRRQSIARAIREAAALGFLEITRPGRHAFGAQRFPALYRLTYIMGWGDAPDPTNDWAKIETEEHANSVLARAGLCRSEQHVQRAVTCRTALRSRRV